MRQAELLEKVKVKHDVSIVRALEQMDQAARQILLVTGDNDRLMGTITDGDVRRALLEGVDLHTPVTGIMNSHPRVLPVDSPRDAARRLMVEQGIRHVPLVDTEGRVVDLVLWQDIFLPRVESRSEAVVIMAGGQGTRLDPFTKILPKPMIPLRDKPIVEVIMDRFCGQGFSRFILCLGYKAEIVRLYFNDDNRSYRTEFVQEDTPLGTAGALSLLMERVDETFILTNCDIIVELDYIHLLEYHRENNYALTVVGTLKEFVVPYGVLHMEDEAFWIEEKPNFHFLVNTGLYVLEPAVLPLIPKGVRADMPEVIAAVRKAGMRIGAYPHHGRWFDVGQWEEYQRTLRLFETIDSGE
ncbi:MAG: nucleotidyltransferase family protein [Candidatus Desulforudis sp.]|nr:nucleotidyltransferase family protein [Desulforudis sp.]